jgi:hypothetical protein
MDTAELTSHALVFLSAWMVLSLPLAVFIGRAIALGAGEVAPQRGSSVATVAEPATDGSASRAAA